MQKNYVLDTNVLINDPRSIFQFEDNYLYIPVYVLEELDRIKSEQSLRGRNSRESCRLIDELRCAGSLAEGVPLPNQGTLTIYVPKERKSLEIALDKNSVDSNILQSALEIKETTNVRTILVTMDVNLRIRAESIGIQAASYKSEEVDTDNLSNKVLEINVALDELNEFYRTGSILVDQSIPVNSSIIFRSPTDSTGLARTKQVAGKVVAKKLNLPPHVLGLKPRNVEQRFAIDLLLDDDVKLVTLMGVAGTGKSLLALATALYSIFEQKLYQKLLVARPIIPLGKDVGFLPGDINEKLLPWMKPIYDNVEYLLMSSGKKYGITSCDELFKKNILEIEPIVYIRGRSIINQIILIDEAQGLNSHEVKTIISRCGENTKIILTGDVDQIDNPYLTRETSGLSIVVDKMQNHPLVGHLRLEKGERSALANLAVSCL